MNKTKVDANVISNLDKGDMFSVLKNFPNQVKEAIEIGEKAPLFKNADAPKKFTVLGMGGSAIGGDLLRSFCRATKGAEKINISINRNYEIPGYLDSDTYVIASSYSGGTEETLQGFAQVSEVTSNILAITAGGELKAKAEKAGLPVISLPGGFMPRCALGYSFFPIIKQLLRVGSFDDAQNIEAQIAETVALLEKRSEEYSIIDENNKAIQLAEKLVGSPVVVYSADLRTDVVNLRWRGQIQENAKQLAFGSFVPEMNHNEINAWDFPADSAKKFAMILLQDKDDHARVAKRFTALNELLKDSVKEIINLQGEGESLLARMFDLIYLGDWVSYYLALMNGVDPMPIPVISKLKDFMSQD